MSQVTNVILTVGAGEDNVPNMLNAAWLDGRPWQDLSWYAAGPKNLECGVYMAGFNHLDLAGFVKAIESIQWDAPECVQLFIQEENEYRFHEVGLWERQS